ncbi:HET domain containing protein [Colletotrichum musicola]|uniref:HET domain containing protein n=1 Tax=Colletotrichum musicola TaxID=2175873 RepID=A0A8H6MLP2_9PEZI|nr:HET domain containing protein [Colletotrichum musicola]
MWLIDTQSLSLQEVVSPSATRYAILSHTWEDDEVSFQDMATPGAASKKAGWAKIAKTCELARARGLTHAWVDTCCIDKSSSAELSEAINSMFQWYEASAVCFVWLADLAPVEGQSPVTGLDRSPNPEVVGKCKWFTRGWTLQELIAPRTVEFYNSNWNLFGDKSSLAWMLARTTRINLAVLASSARLQSTPVAVKMSWAARRKTKRVEDRAYSLLGIFNINMPMIYGEGNKAFRRLQEEIAKETNDLSLFAWKSPVNQDSSTTGPQAFRGIFADSPDEFANCSEMHRSSSDRSAQREFSLTNRGVRIETKLFHDMLGGYVMYLGFVDASRQAGVASQDVCVSLVRTANGFVRCEPWSVEHEQTLLGSDAAQSAATIYVRKNVSLQEAAEIQRRRHRSFHVYVDLPASLRVESVVPHPSHLWDDVYTTFISSTPGSPFAATLNLVVSGREGEFESRFPLVLVLGWHKGKREALAMLYGDDDGDGDDVPRRAVDRALPKGFPDLGKDYEDPILEEVLGRILERPDFRAEEVRFVERRPGPSGFWYWGLETTYIATFGARLETGDVGGDVSVFRVFLTGSLSRADGMEAG